LKRKKKTHIREVLSIRAASGFRNKYVWSGGNELAIPGTFRWTSGRVVLSTHVKWAPNQPNDLTGVSLKRSIVDG